MRLMIIVGVALLAVGAGLSLFAGRKSHIRGIAFGGESAGRLLRRAVLRGAVLLAPYWLVLWATGSLNGGSASSRVYGNASVQTEFLPVTWGSRRVHARPGQKVVVSYQATIERGELDLRLWPSKPWIGNLGPFGGEPIWKGTLERSGKDRLEIPIGREGYYLFNWWPWYRFVGSYRLSWRVE